MFGLENVKERKKNHVKNCFISLGDMKNMMKKNIKKNIKENIIIFSLLFSLKNNEENKRKDKGKVGGNFIGLVKHLLPLPHLLG